MTSVVWGGRGGLWGWVGELSGSFSGEVGLVVGMLGVVFIEA